MRLGTEEHDTHQEALYREDDEELEEELVAPQMTDGRPPTQASAESHIKHGSVVPAGVVEIYDGEHLDCEHGETEVHADADSPTGDTVVAVELTQELGPFDVEAETHGVEAITFPTSSASVQQGEDISGGTVTEADGLQDMGSDSVVVADHYGMSLTESSAARRWWEMYDAGALGKELDNTLVARDSLFAVLLVCTFHPWIITWSFYGS